MHTKRSLLPLSLVVVFAASIASAQARPPWGRCAGPAAIEQRRGELVVRDEHAIDALLARWRTRDALTEVTAVGRDVPGYRGDRGEITYLARGVTLRSMRPLDPAQPSGAAVETRIASDGSVHVFVVQPAIGSDACGVFPRRAEDYRFARDSGGRIVPLRLVFRETPVPIEVCGCVPSGGCGYPRAPMSMIHEFELPVHDAAEIDAPVAVTVRRHTVQMRGRTPCPPMP